MNADHADAMVLYCKAFSKATDITSATMTGVDRYGFDMSAKTPDGPRPVRVAFPKPVRTPEDVMSNRAGGVRRERICLGGLPALLADPGHPSVAADVPDGIHAQLPEREVAEVSVVRGIRMDGQERVSSTATISFDRCACTVRAR